MPATLPLTEIIALIVVGFGTGVLGGLLGIGGSVIMIPVLTLAFRHDQHLSQAAAMIVNIVVAVAGVLRHTRAGAVPWPTVWMLLPAALVAIVVGVEASNGLDGRVLMRIFGAFLLYVIWSNVQRVLAARTAAAKAAATASAPAGGPVADDDAEAAPRGWWRPLVVGTVVGFAAGVLGIGGGIIAVPLAQRILGIPLRRAIAASAALMCLTAPIGAWRKNATLAETIGDAPLTEGVVDVAAAASATASATGDSPLAVSLTIAACLAPTAIIGSWVGAGLTHRLPLRWIRAVLVALLTWAAIKFLTG